MSAREPPARLGRGLAALMGESSALAPTARSGVRSIPVEMLSPGPFQPRALVDPSGLAELTESIRSRGVLQPLLARPDPAASGRYQIIAGERRWRAAQAAGLHEVPALVREFADADAMAASLVENLQRQDLNAIEEAEGYRRLIEEFGLTQEGLGEAVGKSRSHIANTLRLLNLPGVVQVELRHGALSPGHARALLAHADPERAARIVIARGLNVRQTEDLVRRDTERTTTAGSRERSRNADADVLARTISERLGIRVDVANDGTRGMIRLHYSSLDQLDGLVAVLLRE